jgi:hypothetical protein
MKLAELFRKSSWEEIEPVLMRMYPGRENRTGFYRKMFEELQQVTPVEKNVSLEICNRHAVAFTGTSKRSIKNAIEIETFPWEYCLGTNVTKDSIRDFSPEEIICVCLRRMTVCGYTNETMWEEYDIYNARCRRLEMKETVSDGRIPETDGKNRRKTVREKWNSMPLKLWLSKRALSVFKYLFKRKEKDYTYVWELDSYMQPAILSALKGYRRHRAWTKFYPDIPELANEESLQKTLDEIIFAFEQRSCYDDDNIDWARIGSGFRLFGKLFQYL